MRVGNIENRFIFIENARRFALDRVGTEIIRKDDGGYIVEAIDDKPWSEESAKAKLAFDKEPKETYKTDSIQVSGLFLTPKVEKLAKQEFQRLQALKDRPPAVEVIFDFQEDGSKWADKRYTFKADNGKIEATQYPLSKDSALLVSTLDRAVVILDEALDKDDPNRLLDLNIEQIHLLEKADILKPPQKEFLAQHVLTPNAKQAQVLIEKYLGVGAPLRSVGVEALDKLHERLTTSKVKEHLDKLYDIAKNPESFQSSVAEDKTLLNEMAHSLKLVPGFRRYPAALSGGEDKRKLFEDALRTLDHYRYRFRVSHGMQFNKNGITGYGTELNYRIGGGVVSLGMSGRDYDFSQPFSGVDYQDSFGGPRQRFGVGYSSSAFDMRLNAARDDKGKMHLERPQSQMVDQYIGRKADNAKKWGENWVKENPVWTGVIAVGALGAVYAYSKIKPDQEIPVEFGTSTTLYENEFLRIKGAATPKITLKDGKPDVGLKEAAIGLSGNKKDHFYDVNIRHRLDNTSIRSGKIDNTNTEVNLRYGIDNNAVTVDEIYQYHEQNLISRLGYRKDMVLAPGFRAYGQGYVQVQHGMEYQTTGVIVGANKEFGEANAFSVGVNVGYDHRGGWSGGFSLVKEF